MLVKGITERKQDKLDTPLILIDKYPHPEFLSLGDKLGDKVVIDGRNIFKGKFMVIGWARR